MLDTNGEFSYQTKFLDPIMPWKIWKFIHPHFITLIGCLFGISIWPLLMYHLTGWAVLSLLLAGFMDALDGTVARYYRKASPQGAALDIFCDRIVEFAIFLGLYAFDPENRAIPILFMLGSVFLCIISFLIVNIFSDKELRKNFLYSPGLIERAEAFGFFFLMIIWPSFFYPLAWIFIVLVLLTTLIHLWQFFYFSRFIPIKIKDHED